MTTNPTVEAIVEQCDRDAAADWNRQGWKAARRIREGKHDDCSIVQAFARHRITALTQSTADAVAQAYEECAKVADERSAMLPNDSDFHRGYANGRGDAAAAIRARKPASPKDRG